MLKAKLIYDIKCLHCKVSVHIPLTKYIKSYPHEIICPRCRRKMIFAIESGGSNLEGWVKDYEGTMNEVLLKSLKGKKMRLILQKEPHST